MLVPPYDSADVAAVLTATTRTEIRDALAWLAEDHPMPDETDWPALLQALIALGSTSDVLHGRALRRVTREATSSRLDTGRILFDADDIPSPIEFKQALDELVSRSSDGTLCGLTPRGVLNAQCANDRAIETLCYVAGVGYGDAKKWFAPNGAWDLARTQKLLSYVDDLVEERFTEAAPNTEPARAIELRDGSGWNKLEALRTGGVPYEILLAQRAVGGAWLQHKNQTSKQANLVAANMVCQTLQARGVAFRRATSVGGNDKQVDLQEFSGVADKRVGVVVVDSRETAAFGVVFSTANDGGTARANGDGLVRMPLTDLPFALVLSGQGWALRPETDGLAKHFSGRLYTERTIEGLVDSIVATLS